MKVIFSDGWIYFLFKTDNNSIEFKIIGSFLSLWIEIKIITTVSLWIWVLQNFKNQNILKF